MIVDSADCPQLISGLLSGSGEMLKGRVFAGPPPRSGSLGWNNQITLARAEPEAPAKAPSHPGKATQRFPGL